MSFIALNILLLYWYSIFYILTVKILKQFNKEKENIDVIIPDNINFKIAYFLIASAFFSSSLIIVNFDVKLKIEYINFLHNKSILFYYFTYRPSTFLNVVRVKDYWIAPKEYGIIPIKIPE